MAPKRAQEAAKKKAAKQKKILAVLLVGLLVALVFAFMTLSKSSSAAPAPATPAAATTTTPDGSTPTAAPAPTLTAGISAQPVSALRAFTGFGRKDPFHDDGPSSSCSCQSSNPATPAPSTPTPVPITPAPTKEPTICDSSNTSSNAVISLNGKTLALKVGDGFGHASGLSGPVFTLVSVTKSAKTAVILVNGTNIHYALYLGQPLTLDLAPGGTYKIVLKSFGTGN